MADEQTKILEAADVLVELFGRLEAMGREVAGLRADVDSLLWVPPAPGPSPIPIGYHETRRTSFQQGEWIPGTPLLDGEITYPDDPRGNGRRIVRWRSRGRAEFHYDNHADNLDLVYLYAWHYLGRPTFIAPGGWRIANQLHENGSKPEGTNAGSPPWSGQFDEARDVYKFMQKRHDGRFVEEFATPLDDLVGPWTWDVAVKWSKGDDGRLLARLNRTPVFEWFGPTLIAEDAARPYAKGGIYESNNGGETSLDGLGFVSATITTWEPRALDWLALS